MYTANTHFWTAGIDWKLISWLKEKKPMERFVHTVKEKFSLKALKNDVANPVLIVVIAKDGIQETPNEIRSAAGPDAKIIWITDTPETLSEKNLAAINEIWPDINSESLFSFYFGNLQIRLKLEKDKWLTETYLNNTIDSIPDLIWYKDIQGAHLKVNDAFCEVVGKTKEDIAGRGHCYIWGLTPEEYAQGEYVCMETEIEVIEKGVTCVFDEQVKAPEGMRLLKTYKTPIRDVDGKVMGTIGVARNVTKEKQYQDKIIELAQTDALTGLANRRHFEKYINEFKNVNQKIFIYFDIDHFKHVNDTYGHETGDQVLIKVSEYMKETFEDGFLVRLGGDEFLAVFLKETEKQEVENRVKNFIKQIQKSFEKEDNMRGLSASAGIAFGGAKTSTDELLRRSDFALYAAKKAGRACCKIYEDWMRKKMMEPNILIKGK